MLHSHTVHLALTADRVHHSAVQDTDPAEIERCRIAYEEGKRALGEGAKAKNERISALRAKQAGPPRTQVTRCMPTRCTFALGRCTAHNPDGVRTMCGAQAQLTRDRNSRRGSGRIVGVQGASPKRGHAGGVVTHDSV